jgi:hypothetical protein
MIGSEGGHNVIQACMKIYFNVYLCKGVLVFLGLNKWLHVYLGILIILYGTVIWLAAKFLQFVVFLFAVLLSFFIYTISFYFGKLLKGRVIPIFAKKG